MEHRGFGEGRGARDDGVADAVGDDERAGREQEERLGDSGYGAELGDELSHGLREGRFGREGEEVGKGAWRVRDEEELNGIVQKTIDNFALNS